MPSVGKMYNPEKHICKIDRYFTALKQSLKFRPSYSAWMKPRCREMHFYHLIYLDPWSNNGCSIFIVLPLAKQNYLSFIALCVHPFLNVKCPFMKQRMIKTLTTFTPAIADPNHHGHVIISGCLLTSGWFISSAHVYPTMHWHFQSSTAMEQAFQPTLSMLTEVAF